MTDIKVEEIVRLGKYNEKATYPRVIRLTVGNEDEKWQLIGQSKHLRLANGDMSKMYINPDLNKDEREAQKTLIDEIKKKRLDNPTKKYIIRKGKVREKLPEAAHPEA